MRISIPIANTVEVLICDVFVKCEIRLNTQLPPQTVEARLAIERMQYELNNIANNLSRDILKSLEGSKP